MKVTSARYVLSALSERDFPRDGKPEVAFVGRSNVGKSSLLNKLLGRRALARTSRTPGRTRAVNYFLINDRYYFVDLPGYGYAKAGKQMRQDWADLMGTYFSQARGRARIVQLVDAKVGATVLDQEAYEYLRSYDTQAVVVATKIDRVKSSAKHRQLTQIERDLDMDQATPLIPCSARSGEGLKNLWRELEAYLHPGVRPT